MIRGRSINRHARAGRIIRDHAAERGARTRRHVRPKTKSVRPQESIELIEHHAGADTHGAFLEIERADLAIVPREIDNESIADGTAGKSAARAARHHRETGI